MKIERVVPCVPAGGGRHDGGQEHAEGHGVDAALLLLPHPLLLLLLLRPARGARQYPQAPRQRVRCCWDRFLGLHPHLLLLRPARGARQIPQAPLRGVRLLLKVWSIICMSFSLPETRTGSTTKPASTAPESAFCFAESGSGQSDSCLSVFLSSSHAKHNKIRGHCPTEGPAAKVACSIITAHLLLLHCSPCCAVGVQGTEGSF